LGIGLAARAQTSQTNSLVEGNTAFALDLYAHLNDTPGNLFISPYSISSCLAMTYAGARGDTKAQMGRVLHFNQGDVRLHSSFGELQKQLTDAEKPNGIQLAIANALWTQKGEPFLPAFLQTAADDYQADIKQADFTTDADAVRQEINGWVAQKTMDKIQDILPPHSVDDRTRLVLANAIYFKGAWENPFATSHTSTQPFHLSKESQVDVRLMDQVEIFKYTENQDFQALELRYRGPDELLPNGRYLSLPNRGHVSMLILLPRQIEGIGQLEKQLSPGFLDRLLAQMTEQRVRIELPRFKSQSHFKLNDMLVKMGMTDAFIGRKADFSGINGIKRGNDESLYISDVLHQAWVEVTEEGTEAAAATVVHIKAGAAPAPAPSPPVFRADHPFIFLIRDVRSGSLLFIGRMADPP
jgi:serpin B